jgi:hypothetical protein
MSGGPFIAFSVDAGVTRAFAAWDGEDGVLYWLRRRMEEATTGLLIPICTALDYLALTPEDGGKVEVEATTWEALAEAADLPRGLYPVNVALDPTYVDAQVRVARTEIVAAWNAKHGIEAQDERGSRG